MRSAPETFGSTTREISARLFFVHLQEPAAAVAKQLKSGDPYPTMTNTIKKYDCQCGLHCVDEVLPLSTSSKYHSHTPL